MQATEQETKHMTPAKMVAALTANIKAADQSWHRWTALGHEIARRRAIACAQANGATRGPIYAEKLKAMLGQFHPHFKKLSDNGTLTSLDKCIRQIDEVNVFRDTIPEDQRPAHPIRVWTAFNASQFASIDFTADPDPDPIPGPARRGHNRDKSALLREIDQLHEQIDEQRLFTDPTINANRIWRRLVEANGHHPGTAQLAVETGKELFELGRRVQNQDEPADKEG